VLPLRETVPLLAEQPASSGPKSGPEILKLALVLGIPWERILLDEIRAEETCRRHFEDVDCEWPLTAALKILPFTFLRSWRVRDRIEGLSSQARAALDRSAQREIRLVLRRLQGKTRPDQATLAEHLWFAHQRILLLQRVRRAAAQSRGTPPERLAFVCSKTRCCYDDAAWALLQEKLPRRGHRLDVAIRKVREEGFQIPRAETDARSLAQLRRIVRTSPYLFGRRRLPKQKQEPGSFPQRLPHPADTI